MLHAISNHSAALEAAGLTPGSARAPPTANGGSGARGGGGGLRSYHPRHRLLVKQAKDVAAELVRVAILWDEYWLQA